MASQDILGKPELEAEVTDRADVQALINRLTEGFQKVLDANGLDDMTVEEFHLEMKEAANIATGGQHKKKLCFQCKGPIRWPKGWNCKWVPC